MTVSVQSGVSGEELQMQDVSLAPDGDELSFRVRREDSYNVTIYLTNSAGIAQCKGDCQA